MPLITRRRLLLLIPAGLGVGLLLPRMTDEHAVLATLCRGLFFSADDVLPDELHLGAAAARLMEAMPRQTRWRLRGDLHALQWTSLLLTGQRLTRLDAGTLRDLLHTLQTRRSGSSLARLQSLCALACYSHPTVHTAIGYEGPPP